MLGIEHLAIARQLARVLAVDDGDPRAIVELASSPSAAENEQLRPYTADRFGVRGARTSVTEGGRREGVGGIAA